MNNRHIIRAGRPVAAVAATVHAPNAALLIDFDNVTLGIRSDLTKELRTLLNSDIIKGKVAVQRAYADWRRYPQYIVPLSESSIDLIFAPAFGTNKKNATDIRLAVDAIELVFTRPEIGTFILLSGDSDFSSLVIKLKEYGKYVIGVGIRESASDLLIQNCDEYYSYSDLAGLTKEEDTPSIQRDPWELVRRGRGADGPERRRHALRPPQAGDAADRLELRREERRLQPLQQVRDRRRRQGHPDRHQDGERPVRDRAGRGWRGSSAGQRGSGAGGQDDSGAAGHAAGPPGSRPPRSRPRSPEEKKGRGRRRGRGGRGRGEDRPAAEGVSARTGSTSLSLASAFQLMGQALAEMPNPVAHETLRARMAALHGREDALLEAGRFAKLLRQANDAEVADVRKTGDDTYEVSVHPTDIVVPRQRPAAKPSPAVNAVAAPTPNGDRAAPVADVVSVMPTAPVRFRRDSRLGTHKPEILMVGVVRVDDEHGGAAGQGGSGAVKKGKAPKASKPAAEKPAAAPKKKAARKPRAKKAE